MQKADNARRRCYRKKSYSFPSNKFPQIKKDGFDRNGRSRLFILNIDWHHIFYRFTPGKLFSDRSRADFCDLCAGGNK